MSAFIRNHCRFIYFLHNEIKADTWNCVGRSKRPSAPLQVTVIRDDWNAEIGFHLLELHVWKSCLGTGIIFKFHIQGERHIIGGHCGKDALSDSRFFRTYRMLKAVIGTIEREEHVYRKNVEQCKPCGFCVIKNQIFKHRLLYVEGTKIFPNFVLISRLINNRQSTNDEERVCRKNGTFFKSTLEISFVTFLT